MAAYRVNDTITVGVSVTITAILARKHPEQREKNEREGAQLYYR